MSAFDDYVSSSEEGGAPEYDYDALIVEEDRKKPNKRSDKETTKRKQMHGGAAPIATSTNVPAGVKEQLRQLLGGRYIKE